MRLRTLALGVVLSASGGAAVAQQTPQAPNIAGARQWKVDARVSAYYDNNVSRTSDAVAATRGLTKDDYTITPMLAANIAQPIGQQVLFLDGLVGYDFHVNNTVLDRRRYNITGGAAGVVGPCQPMFYGSYRALQSDLADLNVGTTENLQTTKSISAGVTCGRGVGLGGAITAQRSDAKNSAAQLNVQDYTSEVLFLAINYNMPSLANASVFYTHASNEYPNRIIPGRPVGDGFFTETAGLRLERKFGSRITTGGAVSATRLKREFAPPGTKPKITAITYQGDASYKAGTRLVLNLNAARNVRPSDRPGKLFDVAEQLEGSARYRLGSNISVNVGHLYAEVRSNVDTLAVGQVVTNSRTNSTYGQVEFRRIGNGSLTLDVRHDRRDTNLPSFNYTSMRVGLTAAYSF